MNTSKRIESLDCFRGLVIALMMFVNCAGGDAAFPSWIGHRGWNEGQQGLGLADFVFPLFIFIMGAGAWFTIHSAHKRQFSTRTMLRQALLRALWLYSCGVLLKCVGMGFDHALTWRIVLQWDILQMLAWCGLVTKALLLLPPWFGRLFIVAAISWKWFLLGSMTFGGATDHVWTPQANAQKQMIEQFGWLGVAFTQGAGASALCMIGAEVARSVFGADPPTNAARNLAIAGIVAGVLAIWWSSLALPAGMPLSKDFFTSSYIVLNAGIGAVLLCTLWWIVDQRRFAKLELLCMLGKHALTVYMTAEFLWRVALTRLKVQGPGSDEMTLLSGIKAHLASMTTPVAASWITVVVYVASWFGFAWYQENRKRTANNPA